jgi:hypothetical protein
MKKPNYSPEAKARRNEYNRRWRESHPEYGKQKYAALSPEKKAEYLADKREKYKTAWGEIHRASARASVWKRKLKMIEAYGGKCVCCGETQPKFLTIDHIHGGGAKHVRSVGKGRGHSFYYWLEQQGYPKDDFQLLCWNCNAAKTILSGCPHMERDGEYGLSGC